MNQQEETNRRLYRIPSGASYQLRSKNAVYISPNNTLRHELAKTIGAYCLRSRGDIPRFSEKLSNLLCEIQIELKTLIKDFPIEKSSFITEAVIKKQPDRRVDLVRLSDNTQFEFETQKIKKEGAITIYI